MQFHVSSTMATPENIINAAISAFNQQASVERHKSFLPLDKERLVANDPFYVDVQPYSLFYRLTIALAAAADKEQTKALFDLSDGQIDGIAKRAQTSLETGHVRTWDALNQIERVAKKDGYKIPEIAQVQVPAAHEKDEIVRRPYNPTIALPAFTPGSTNPARKNTKEAIKPEASKPATQASTYSTAIKPRAKPANDMAKAAAQTQESKPPIQRKKRSELTLGKNITSLTIPQIAEACLTLHDELGLGLVSMEQFSSRKYASPETTKVREFTAYAAYRVLPFSNYSLDRIASGAFITEEPVKNSLEKVEKNISMQDKGTTKFLLALSQKLELTELQKTLLFVPTKPRFKSWHELQDLSVKGQSPSRSPEGP